MADNDYSEEELIALLPWYVNGTLSVAEKEAVEALLRESENARAEVAALQAVAAEVVAGEQRGSAPAELGWRRLQRDMRASKSAASTPRWQRLAAIAATVVIAVQAGLLLQKPDTAEDIRLLAGHDLTDHPLQSLGEYHVFQFRFNEQADIEAANAGLLKFEAEIIEGPSALGVYRLTIPKKYPPAEVIAFFEAQPYFEYIAREEPE